MAISKCKVMIIQDDCLTGYYACTWDMCQGWVKHVFCKTYLQALRHADCFSRGNRHRRNEHWCAGKRIVDVLEKDSNSFDVRVCNQRRDYPGGWHTVAYGLTYKEALKLSKELAECIRSNAIPGSIV